MNFDLIVPVVTDNLVGSAFMLAKSVELHFCKKKKMTKYEHQMFLFFLHGGKSSYILYIFRKFCEAIYVRLEKAGHLIYI